MNWGLFGRIGLATLADGRAAKCILLVLVVVMAVPVVIGSMLAAVLGRIPAVPDDVLARYKAQVIQAAQAAGIGELDWREVVAAAAVLCRQDFASAPAADLLVREWIGTTTHYVWSAVTGSYIPVTVAAVRPFEDVLAQLRFTEDEREAAMTYLAGLVEGGL